jgi:hypothetical protein
LISGAPASCGVELAHHAEYAMRRGLVVYNSQQACQHSLSPTSTVNIPSRSINQSINQSKLLFIISNLVH